MKNQSSSYGYYGGVTNENRYIPPPSAPFVPQPPSVPFFKDLEQSISTLLTAVETTQSFLSTYDDILLRRYLVQRVDNIETYKINTNENPNDLLVYTDGISGIDAGRSLLVMDGGTF